MAAYSHDGSDLQFVERRSAYEHYDDDDDDAQAAISIREPTTHEISTTRPSLVKDDEDLEAQKPSTAKTHKESKRVHDTNTQSFSHPEIETYLIPSLFSSPSDTWKSKLIPRAHWFRMTTFALSLQVVMFIVELIVGSTKSDLLAKSNHLFGPGLATILTLGGSNGRLIGLGQIYRLFVSQILTLGFIQLIWNSLLLLRLGYTYEKRWSGLRFAVVYILGGISASLWLGAIRNDATSTTSSAAINALIAADLFYVLWNWRDIHLGIIELLISAICIGLTFMLGALSGGGLEVISLLGGIVSGVLSGGFLLPRVVKRNRETTTTAICGMAWIIQFLVTVLLLYSLQWK